MSHPTERRASPRCDVVDNQLRLEFAVPDGMRRVEARLLNISRNGALIRSADVPPVEAPIWLRVERPVKTDWVHATIVRFGQNQEIGVRFPRGCPDDLLVAGTVGIDLTSMLFDRTTIASTFD